MTGGGRLYDEQAQGWWEENHFLYLLHSAMTPARLAYFRSVFRATGTDPAGKKALDVGCGGGSLAEALADMGWHISGLDPSFPTITVARAHAAQRSLAIDYLVAAGERIPVGDNRFDVVCCCDTLEHVEDVERVIAESARVLKPGGLYLFDTPNRTRLSRLILIDLLQRWRWSRLLPPDLHEWERFIRPEELRRLLTRHGIRTVETVGLAPGAGVWRLLASYLGLKVGTLSYGQAGRGLRLARSEHQAIAYMGYGVAGAG